MTGADGRFSEDLQFRIVNPDLNYDWRTDGPVVYVAVGTPHVVLGYLWASDEDSAAGWVARPASGPLAVNAGVAWYRRLRPFKAEGVPPSRALAVLASDNPAQAWIGQVIEGSSRVAASLADLRALAAGQSDAEEGPGC